MLPIHGLLKSIWLFTRKMRSLSVFDVLRHAINRSGSARAVRSGVGPDTRFAPLTVFGYFVVGISCGGPLGLLYCLRFIWNAVRISKK